MTSKNIDMVIHEVPLNIAKKILDKRTAEVVDRLTDGKIKGIGKYAISVVSDETIKKSLLDKTCQLLGNSISGPINILFSFINNVQTERVRRTVNELKDITVQMAGKIDLIYNDMATIKAVSFLNTGLSIVNIGVSVAGFKIVIKKIDEIEKKIDNIESVVNKIYINQVRDNRKEKRKEFREIQYSIAVFIERIRKNEEIDFKDFAHLINEICCFIDDMTDDIIEDAIEDAAEKEMILKMIFDLLPFYTSFLIKFYEIYYFEHEDYLLSQVQWIETYNRLLGKKVITYIQDYFILDKRMLKRDVDIQIAIIYSSVIQQNKTLQDTLYLMKIFENREDYNQLVLGINNATKKIVTELVPILTDKGNYSRDEANKIINDAINNTIA